MRYCRIRLITFILFICLILTACGKNNPASSSGTTYQVSPSFREFYESLGGEDVLGAAISKSFSEQSYECQYTVNALLCLNPTITDSSRFFLFPLGNDMNVREDPAQSPAQSGTQVVDGYTIYDEFIPLYNQLSGEKYAGKPITQAHLNYSQQRVEQFFENVGFYRNFSDSTGAVHLMAYGAYACAATCDYTPSIEASILNANRASENQPMINGLSELGDTSILGKALTQPYIASDGQEEQVYENAVLYAPAANLTSSSLRPLGLLLDMPKSDPVEKKYSSSDGMTFYATDGSRGYHVPLVFDHFIAAHGGTDYSGKPIDEVFAVGGNVYRQCFEYYCLDYDASAPKDQNVKLTSLGYQYLEQITGNSSASPQFFEISPETVTLQISRQYSEVSSTTPQMISILVTRKENQQPVAGIEADLTLLLPDGTQYASTMEPTGLDGTSTISIPYMDKLTNGSIVTYQVCLKGTTSGSVCASGNYLIWESN